jgi:hypothetical protein
MSDVQEQEEPLNLQKMLRAIQAVPIEYSPEQHCFILNGTTRCYGLTNIIQGILPVPRSEGQYAADALDPVTEAELASIKKKPGFRRSRNDPTPHKTVWNITDHPSAQRIYKLAAPNCKHAVSRCVLEHIPEHKGRSGFGVDYWKRHGTLVDETIKVYVSGGSAALKIMARNAGVDPCAATLIDFLADNGYRIVACQVPIHSQLLGVGTSIDVIVTDVATGTECYIFEIKSTCADTPKAIERGDQSFEMLRGRLKNTTLKGMILSHYGLSQVQAWTQMAIVKATTNMSPTGVSVLRVSPGLVREYPLNLYYEERAEKLGKAIAIQTGQHKRNLKRARDEKKEGRKKAKK